MKKTSKKYDLVKIISSIVGVIGFILFIVAAFLKKADTKMLVDIIGMVLFLGGGLVSTYRSKEHTVAKMLIFVIFATVILTWVFPQGTFQPGGVKAGMNEGEYIVTSGDFSEIGLNRLGLTSIGNYFSWSLSYIAEKIVFLFIIAGFYGVLSKTSGYRKLIDTLAEKLQKHVIITSVVISILVVGLSSILTQSLALLIILPFFISLLLRMKVDKLTTFAITFGSMLIGALGATYGSDGLIGFVKYVNSGIQDLINYSQQLLYYYGYSMQYPIMSVDLNRGLEYRAIILAVAFLLYLFFIVMRLRKVVNENKQESVEDVAFAIEPTKEKVSIIPMAIILVLTFAITILGFVDWNTNFGITIFNDFHEWLIGLTIKKDMPIISYILGTEDAVAFGLFTLKSVMIYLIAMSLLAGILYHTKINEMITNFCNGMREMFKPVLYMVGAFIIVGIVYNLPFTMTIMNYLLNSVKGFNPYMTSLCAFVTSIFHGELGLILTYFTPFMLTTYATDYNLVSTIFLAIQGLVNIIAPTSVIMLLGLSIMHVDYKSWFRYIWMFVVGMLVILLVLFTVLN